MKLELTKGQTGFDEIHWVAKALTKNKSTLKYHIKRILKDKNLFVAMNGSRMHVYDHKGFFDEFEDGYYKVIKNTQTKVILLFDKSKDEGKYPDIEDFIAIRLDFPKDSFQVDYDYDGSKASYAYTIIVRNMKSEVEEVKPKTTNFIRYSFLEDVLKIKRIFNVYQENENQPVYFKSDNLFGAIMPIIGKKI